MLLQNVVRYKVSLFWIQNDILRQKAPLQLLLIVIFGEEINATLQFAQLYTVHEFKPRKATGRSAVIVLREPFDKRFATV